MTNMINFRKGALVRVERKDVPMREDAVHALEYFARDSTDFRWGHDDVLFTYTLIKDGPIVLPEEPTLGWLSTKRGPFFGYVWERKSDKTVFIKNETSTSTVIELENVSDFVEAITLHPDDLKPLIVASEGIQFPSGLLTAVRNFIKDNDLGGDSD